jgi:hypothetical protein
LLKEQNSLSDDAPRSTVMNYFYFQLRLFEKKQSYLVLFRQQFKSSSITTNIVVVGINLKNYSIVALRLELNLFKASTDT